MAMLPFCGYNMGEYFLHWLRMRKFLAAPPRIFHVNWFRKSTDGRFLWPGFGENMRVLKWIIDRCRGRAAAEETPLGWVPGPDAFDLGGMEDFDVGDLADVQTINVEEWRDEVLKTEGLFMKIYPHLPKEMIFQRELLIARL
jgi:phosphoenolpyruvate carboxykinase (GTP)